MHEPILKLHSVSTDLPILGLSYKWNHALNGLLCLASFTEHDVFIIHPCCRMYPHLFLFTAEYYSAVWICHILLSIHQLMNA